MNILLKILTVLFTKKDNSGSLKDHSITIDFEEVEHINGKILKADEINGNNRRIMDNFNLRMKWNDDEKTLTHTNNQ